MLVALIGMLYLLHRSLKDMRSLAEQALLTSKAVSARDLAEAKEYSEDARFSREISKAETGPSIATISQPEETYTTPEGVTLKVLKPFL
jgi:hypothetical protein